MRKALVLPNFWVPTKGVPDSNLCSDKVGWTTESKVESGRYDTTKEAWNHLVLRVGK